MRMTLYYMVHACKNQIKKLFRSWVAIFLVICFAVGLLFGLGSVALSELFEDDLPADDEIVEEIPDEGVEEMTPEVALQLVELMVGGVVLLVFFFSAHGADKSASSIFLMADVNLLFQAPLRPQSVLLFRLIMQAGTSFVATAYLLFQIPNLVTNLGLNAPAVIAIIVAWFLLLFFSKLIAVLFYTLSADHPTFKKQFRYWLYAGVVIIGGVFWLYAQNQLQSVTEEINPGHWFDAAFSFFNAPVTRYIPLWGWLKGFVMCTVTGDMLWSLIYLLLLVAGALLMLLVVRRTKADFYEEAMARSEETAEMLAAAQQSKTGMAKRKKNRSEKLAEGSFDKGHGATVYFYKVLYNRFRFAHFRVFTKTSETYLLAAAGIAVLQILVLKTSFFPVVPLAFAGIAFFRSLGNPMMTDLSQESFLMVPDSSHRKIFFAFLGGTLNSLLDMLPGFIVGAALLLRTNPAQALVWLVLAVSMGAYAESVGLFLDLSMPTSLSQMIRSMIMVLFVYLGLAPAAVLIVLGFAFDRVLLFGSIAALFNLAIIALSLGISPLLMDRGRK